MMMPHTTIVAALEAGATMGEVLQFILGGLLVVLVALSLLSLCCVVVGRVLRVFDHPAPAASPAVVSDGIPDETIAVIAAAVAVAIDRPHRIVHVRGLTPEDAAWALEGRRQHHSSHLLPHRESR